MSSLRRMTRTHLLRRTQVCGAREEEDDKEDLLEEPANAEAVPPVNNRSSWGGLSAVH